MSLRETLLLRLAPLSFVAANHFKQLLAKFGVVRSGVSTVLRLYGMRRAGWHSHGFSLGGDGPATFQILGTGWEFFAFVVAILQLLKCVAERRFSELG